MGGKFALEVPLFFVTLGFMFAGSLFVVYVLHTLLGIREPVRILIGSIFGVLSSVTFGFAVKDWQIYFASVGSNLLIYRTCYVLLHENRTECAQLGFVTNNETEYLEKLVEPTATYISLIKTIIESICGTVTCLFMAPWSDRFGRKPVILLGFAGGAMTLLLHVVFAAIDTLSPWYLLVVMVPSLLSGGGAGFAVMQAYLTDSTTKDGRALRMGIFNAVQAVAVLVGNTSSSYLLIATNYVTVYCLSLASHLVALVYTVFFIDESLQNRETAHPIRGFFTWTNLVEMAKTPFRRRDHYKRAILLLIIASMLIGFLASGSGQLFFYFLREKLDWTLVQYTWLGTARDIIGIIGSLFVVYVLHTLLGIREPVLILIGSIFGVLSSVCFGFAVKDWQIYFGTVLNMPTSGQGALMSSFVSKLVHEEEVAKVLSAIGIGTNVLGPISSTIYTALYNATIDTDAGLYNFVTAVILSVSALIFSVVVVIHIRTPGEEYNALINDPSPPGDDSSSELGTSVETVSDK